MGINQGIIKQIHSLITERSNTYLIVVGAIIIFFTYYGYMKFNAYQDDKKQTLAFIEKPKIDDIYFLDFRLLSEKLRPTEKYRIAKVVDITGDIVTLLYGSFYYLHQNAALNSIYYGQLAHIDYFEPTRYNLPHSQIKKMHTNHAIYLAKRPINKKLYGNLVGFENLNEPSTLFIVGKKENSRGVAFLNQPHSDINVKSAFNLFKQSSTLGYALGQVHLAEMYIKGQYIEKDFTQALYWLKQASLQSNKSAILKYGIVCNQVSSCNLADFYRTLQSSGVNIKVRDIDLERSDRI